MLYLHKILPVFLLPVGMTLLLVLAGLWLRRRALIWTGVAVLWLGSTPLLERFDGPSRGSVGRARTGHR